MKFENINGMQAITKKGKIIMWVLTTCNDKWCYDIVGAKTAVKPVDTYGQAVNDALDDLMQIQAHTAQVIGVAMFMATYFMASII